MCVEACHGRFGRGRWGIEARLADARPVSFACVSARCIACRFVLVVMCRHNDGEQAAGGARAEHGERMCGMPECDGSAVGLRGICVLVELVSVR